LGLVDLEPARGVRVQAGRFPDRTVDVGDHAAAAADHVVVVVAGAGLVPGRGAGRLDPPGQAGAGERAQHVVDRLRRDRGESGADPGRDLVDVQVPALA